MQKKKDYLEKGGEESVLAVSLYIGLRLSSWVYVCMYVGKLAFP